MSAAGDAGVWAIVAHYGDPGPTRRCLRALGDAVPPERRLVVDNQGGFDDEAALVLRPGANIGFAGAAALGARRARAEGGRWLWFVNNDAEVSGDCLGALLEAGAADAAAGFLSPVITYGATDEVWFAGGFVDEGSLRTGHTTAVQGDRPYPTGYVTGCAMLVRGEVVDTCGVPDERLFMYLEDVDWCLRGRQRGWRSLVVPGARAGHDVERRDRRRVFSARAVYYVTRNRLLVARRSTTPARALPPALDWAGRQALKGGDAGGVARASLALAAGLADGLAGRSGRATPGLERMLD